MHVPDLHLFITVILSALGLPDNYTQQPAATADWVAYRQWCSVSYGERQKNIRVLPKPKYSLHIIRKEAV